MFFLTALTTHAQNHLGTWSFERLDEAAMADDVSPESRAMLSTIFNSFEIKFSEDLTFDLNLLGSDNQGTYEVFNDSLVLSTNSIFKQLDDQYALFIEGNSQMFLKKGAVTIPVSSNYEYLTAVSYEPIEFNGDDLIGSWKAIEVKGSDREEAPETTEALLSSLVLIFESDGSLIFSVFGLDQQQSWKLGNDKGELIVGAEKTIPKTYYVHKLDEKELIVELKSTGTLIYLNKQ